MSPMVDFLPKEVIEAKAEDLLTAFGRVCFQITSPPIPIEDILVSLIKFSFDFDDLHDLKEGVDGEEVLGATWVKSRAVYIDNSLNPDERATMRGRYRFTLAHEIAHWQLHRRYFVLDEAHAELPTEVLMEGPGISLTSEAKRRMEWQANFFASCLLMPRTMVFDAWREARRFVETFRFKRDAALKRPVLRREVLRHIINVFEVSPIALCIRLAELGFLERYGLKKPASSEAA